EANIDDRFFAEPLPYNQRHKTHTRYDRQRCKKPRAKPIDLLPFIQHHLQGANYERQKVYAGIIQLDARCLETAEVGGIVDKSKNEQQREDADGQIDKEDPAP